jgi:hypothetical protein
MTIRTVRTDGSRILTVEVFQNSPEPGDSNYDPDFSNWIDSLEVSVRPNIILECIKAIPPAHFSLSELSEGVYFGKVTDSLKGICIRDIDDLLTWMAVKLSDTISSDEILNSDDDETKAKITSLTFLFDVICHSLRQKRLFEEYGSTNDIFMELDETFAWLYSPNPENE